ncbi:MAG: hypothetical protein V3T67_07510 [Nitrosopumilaceae archaeon]
MEAMLSEFLRSFGVGIGIPIAVFSVFRLRKGSFSSSDFSSKSFDTDRVEINKQSLVMLIVAILALYPIFL